MREFLAEGDVSFRFFLQFRASDDDFTTYASFSYWWQRYSRSWEME
jgi:hypothetical protein